MKLLTRCALALCIAVVGAAAQALPITPTFDTFGPLAGATYGGTGIPTDPSAVSMGGGITLGLIATQRFANPALSNDGAGTFTAGAGANFGGPGDPSTLLGALWNLGFYVDVPGGTPLSDVTVLLRYDFDPGAGTDRADHGVIDFGALLASPPPLGGSLTAYPGGPLQGSENMLFGFLGVAIPGVLTPPVFGPFDPFAAGEYTFELEALDAAGAPLARSAIAVNVVGVPEPGTLALACGGIALLARVRRRG